ncbi:MAG: ImmA/IrrE family metallo-endopeptidase [Ignavibacteria bacterium]|jgi:Zn-dependent peptidase ImmA (M78 family)|nr:ImmA/IrrE family metallo-endopeptidase [Ignavibacteria bacterium]MCU7515157.1 ImmA/IrrE family metallo-endopeptidase [Ignavibacteria bacterium]MCU7519630.1 ImmA/IrrE family metallo-endopeptidase [Ignavibacteria bacterium]
MQSKLAIKKAAIEFRELKGFGSCDSIDTHKLLKDNNVITVFRKLDPDFSGMALKADEMNFILINASHSIGRQNFTILHEMYHLFIQTSFSSMLCNAGAFDKQQGIEYEADWFAVNALMPEQGILERIPASELKKNISLATILDIEQYFACSRSALLIQLKEMNLITSEQFHEFKNKVKYNAKLYGYDTALYNEGNDGMVIGDYGLKARTLFEREFISESNYASLMREIGIDVDSEESE